MMIVTNTSLKSFRVVLGCHQTDGDPKLTCINWLAADEGWQDGKSLAKLTKHYRLTDSDIQFIESDSLSNSDAIQAMLLTAINQLGEYCEGKRTAFSLSLDTSIGTPFQRQVWSALQAIPFGETINYATLAKSIDKPTAYRAVANANGKNPFPIVIPCHRVIASDGSLGGYTGGLNIKRFLLSLESQ